MFLLLLFHVHMFTINDHNVEELSGETPTTTVGQIFIQFVSFVQTYVDYTNLYDKMITFMRNKKAQNKKFKDLLDVRASLYFVLFFCFSLHAHLS